MGSPPEFGVVHATRECRSQWLKRAVTDLGRIKQKLGITRSLGFLNGLNRRNVKPAAPTIVPPELIAEKMSVFAEDIARIKSVTDRLDAWWPKQGKNS